MAMDDVKKELFLEHYRVHGNISAACRHLGYKSSNVYYTWIEDDEEFALEAERAFEESVDEAEAELRARAVTGKEYPVTLKDGTPVYKRDPDTGEIMMDENFDPIPLTVTRTNDDLLKFYIAGVRRRRFGTTSSVKMEHSGPGGGPIPTKVELVFIDAVDGKPAPGQEEAAGTGTGESTAEE